LTRHTGDVPAERISFLVLPSGPTTQPGRNGGDGRAVGSGRPTPAPRYVAPTRAPAVVPAAPPPAAGVPDRTGAPGGSGAVVGEAGPTEGMRPTFADPRLWDRPGSHVVSAPKSAKE